MQSRHTYGKDSHGNLVHISSVPSGLACGCYCPSEECSAQLVARFYKDGSKIDHFSHRPGSACKNPHQARMTELHWAAQIYIAKSKVITTPSHSLTLMKSTSYGEQIIASRRIQSSPRKITFDSVDMEKVSGSLRPDLIGYLDGRSLWIEIKVTHSVGDQKSEKIRSLDQPALEIDLSSHKDIPLSEKTLSEIIHNPDNCRWIHHSLNNETLSSLSNELEKSIIAAEQEHLNRTREEEENERIKKQRERMIQDEVRKSQIQLMEQANLRRSEIKKKAVQEEKSKADASFKRSIRFSISELSRLEDTVSEHANALPWQTQNHYWQSASKKIGLNPNLTPPKVIYSLVVRDIQYPSSFNVDHVTLQFCIFSLIFFGLSSHNKRNGGAITFDYLTIKDALRKEFGIHESYDIKHARSHADKLDTTINFEQYTNEAVNSYLFSLAEQGFITSNGDAIYTSNDPIRSDIITGIQRALSARTLP